MKWIKLSDVVYGTSADIVKIDRNDLLFLKEQVSMTSAKRIRICAHSQLSDKLHEMLIVISKDSYIQPHKHIDKSESFHIIEGELDVVIFDEVGKITDIIRMGDIRSGLKFFYRLSGAYYHTLVLRTDFVVFHETTNGPFAKEDTLYAPWAPSQEETVLVKNYMHKLSQRVAKQKDYIS